MTVLIDPHLLIAPTTCGELDEELFWQRLVTVASAGRAEIGHETFHWVVDRLQHLGYPDQQVNFGPPYFARECQSAMEKLLSRVSKGTNEVVEHALHPSYLGDTDARLCIIIDSVEHSDSLEALLSDPAHWNPSVGSATLGPITFELLFDPEAEPAGASAADIKEAFVGRRLHLVGGAQTASALANFDSVLGVASEDVHWVVGEKSKPPRELDKKWSGLDPSRDVAICITGRVGHATSEQARTAAEKRGLTLIYCPTQGQIVDYLIEWAGRQPKAAATE